MTTYTQTQDITVPNWLIASGKIELKNLNGITILFGKNGSGKSQILRSWRNSDVNNCHYVVPERTGPMKFNAGFLSDQTNATGRKGNSEGNYSDNYRQLIVTRIQAYFLARGNTRNNNLSGNPADLEQLLRVLLPDFTIELKATANPPYELFREEKLVNNVNELSSGESQLLTLALDILTIGAMWDIQDLPKRIMLIDEPDAHIHPDLQVRFADFLIQVAKKYKLQMVIATHSTTLLSAMGQFGENDTSVIYIGREKSCYKAEHFNDIQKELSACLGGHALMGPMFGIPLLLVEGDDEYRIWSQIPRHHKVSFSVIPCDGVENVKKYQKSLEKIFASIRENNAGLSGYALIDGDRDVPTENPDCPQKHIKFVGMQCLEAENLYLTDEVLSSINLSWEVACNKIIQEAINYGDKKDSLLDVKNWDRKKTKVKSVIKEVAQILDPKGVHWTIRVASVLGENYPQGQIADFLGEEVVKSIWSQSN